MYEIMKAAIYFAKCVALIIGVSIWTVSGVQTQCDICVLDQIITCTENVSLNCTAGSRTEVVKGTICVHELCGIYRSAECTIGGRWVGLDGKEVKRGVDKKCENKEFQFEEKKIRVKRGWFRRRRRSPPPPPPNCGYPGAIAHTSLSVTSTSQGGVATYTCHSGYGHTGGTLRRVCQSNAVWSGSPPTCSYMNSCSSGPCKNGGSCRNIPNSYTCSCPSIWKGSRCEIDTDECASTSLNKCNQKCSNTYGSFTCSCNTGYRLLPDKHTCIDIDECAEKTSGCDQACANSAGSFKCSCREGFELSSDGKSCRDIDECTRGTSGCEHTCSNTIGSFTCSCKTGYQLAINGKSCSDIDECTSGSAHCQVHCTNTVGSYHCSCEKGYTLAADGKTCKDVDECATGNGSCDQVCMNAPGSYTCECNSGFALGKDGHKCSDIDECAKDISGCSQNCTNTRGSFECSCITGYELQPDKKTCTDIDDCKGVICQNGGTCRDGLNEYSCTCAEGFTSRHCEKDINECAIHNGGCQDACINTPGSYHCGCFDGRQIQADGRSCSGGDRDTVFQRFKISGGKLPKACFVLPLAHCTDGKNHGTQLTSTSEWYGLTGNLSTSFTLGIVFIKVNDLSLPLSIQGLEVTISSGEFTVNYGTKYNSSEGTVIRNSDTPADCKSFELLESDIFEFISAGSFLKTYLQNLFPALPNWIKFKKLRESVLAIQDLKSDLVYGRHMEQTTWCEGAPVLDDHLYSVFRFGSTFSLEVLGDKIIIPKVLTSQKFCFIVDLCHSNGGSIFFMVPEESRDILQTINMFKLLKKEDELTIHPRGIGISKVNGIDVHKDTTELQLWNGDAMFQYPVFQRGDFWIGADVVKNDKKLLVNASADIFIGMPDIEIMLTSIFLDEWNTYVRMTLAASPTLKFKLFGKEYSITFKSLVTAEMNMYLSVGGSQRVWCGMKANPPGVFFSFRLEINPFKNVPMLGEWGVANVHKAYGFITYEPPQAVVDINIKEDILNFRDILDRLKARFKSELKTLGIIYRNTTLVLVNDIEANFDKMKVLVKDLLDDILSGDWKAKKRILEQLWQEYQKVEHRLKLFFDDTEFIAQNAFKNFTNIIKDEINVVKSNLKNAMEKVTNSLVIKNTPESGYTGFGLKYTTNVQFLGLKLGEFDLEIVDSVEHLFKCSRFDSIRKHFEGEKAIRFIGRASRVFVFYVFIKIHLGGGIGGALSADKDKFALQLEAYAQFLGMKATTDLFITNKGLYLFMEGNVWDIFLAQLDISAEMKSEWHHIVYRVSGRFLAKSRKRRQIQTRSESFQDSYLDALKKVVNKIADMATKRLSQAQEGLNVAKEGLSKAQDWLEKKKAVVRGANEKFDRAVAAFDRAKDKVEAAKKPFEDALRKLDAAQRKVDNLCRIRSCKKFCIPGVKCRICRKKVGFVKIPYPCCRFTSCMIKVPDPICVAANLACRVIRGAAYLALEAAKIFVRVPMLAFDVAKAALSAAQFVVDKSRVVLDVAVGLLDVAKLGLEFSKGVLESAKAVLEGVKIAIGVAAKILEFVIDVGLKNLLDVRNCGFNVELSTHDLPVFDISCDVNAFRLGWKTITIRINFKNIVQSLWNAARATIDMLSKLIGGIGRKRRELEFRASAKMHAYLRHVREANDNGTFRFSNESNEVIDIVDKILGFENKTDTDYESRSIIFKEKCKSTTHVMKFMSEALGSLNEIINESRSYMDEMAAINDQLHQFTIDGIADNMTLENAGISKEYAERDYNMTEDDLNRALNESKAALADDPLLREINASTTLALESLNAEKESIESINFLEIWLEGMSNKSSEYFSISECNGFKDCVLFAISELYTSFEDVDIPDADKIRESILDLESVLIELFQNQSSLIQESAAAMDSIMSNVTFLNEANPFCSEAPVFQTVMKNQTVLNGTNVALSCNVTGSPFPSIKWFMDGNLLPNETGTELVISNVTVNDSGVYRCEAGNVVANITSHDVYLQVVTYDDDECQTSNGGCEQICENFVGSYICKCLNGYRLSDDTKTCSDIDECLIGSSTCDQICSNVEGSFTCGCEEGYELEGDGRSCKVSSGLDDRIIVVIGVCGAVVLAILVAIVTYWYLHLRSPKVLPEVEKEVEMTYVKPFTYGPMPTVEYGPAKPVFDQKSTVKSSGKVKE